MQDIQDESELLQMNTRKVASEYRLTHWAGVLQERSSSGLSIREYCKTSGIAENVYFYWQRKIREAACEQLALSGSSFTEVMVAEPQHTCIGEINIAVGNVRITVDGSYPPDRLAMLIRELTRV